MGERHIVGASVPRKEGWDKVTGAARYVDDMVLPGMLYGATVRSSVARGMIRKISFDASVAWDEFVVVTAKDIPGKNCIAMQTVTSFERLSMPFRSNMSRSTRFIRSKKASNEPQSSGAPTTPSRAI